MSLPPSVRPFSVWTPLINLPVFVQYRIIQFVLFWIWLSLSNIMLVYSPILPYVVVDFSFFLLYSSMWVYHNLLIFCNSWWTFWNFEMAIFEGLQRNPSAQIYLYSEPYMVKFLVEIFPLADTLTITWLMELIHSCMSWLLFLLYLFSIVTFPWCLCQTYTELLSSFLLCVFHSG